MGTQEWIAIAAWASIIATVITSVIAVAVYIAKQFMHLGIRMAAFETESAHDRRCKMVVVQGVRHMRRLLRTHLEQSTLWREQIAIRVDKLENQTDKET